MRLEQLEDRMVPSASGIDSLAAVASPAVQSGAVVSPLVNPSPDGGYTPAQIRHAYGFDNISFTNGTIQGDGSGRTIAIIDSYYDPDISSDVDVFDKQYGWTSTSSQNLFQQYGPSTSFLTVYRQYNANGQEVGTPPLPSTGAPSNFAREEALDVEWAHAIAPGAKIILLDVNNDDSYIYSKTGVQWAADQPNVSVVSMSFGLSIQGESLYDTALATPQDKADAGVGVAFVASAGDDAEFTYPASSPNVIGVGGTTLTADSSGNYISEIVWNNGHNTSGGGSDPNYSSQSFNPKQGPDVGYNAEGFSVYDSYDPNNPNVPLSGQQAWHYTTGTSCGAPQWAALIAIADQGLALQNLPSLDTAQVLNRFQSSDFHTNIKGTFTDASGNVVGGSQVVGWGTPYADRVVSDLSGQPIYIPPTPQPPPPQPPSSSPTSSPHSTISTANGIELTSSSPPLDPSLAQRVGDVALSLAEDYEFGNTAGADADLLDFEFLLLTSPSTSWSAEVGFFLNVVFQTLDAGSVINTYGRAIS